MGGSALGRRVLVAVIGIPIAVAAGYAGGLVLASVLALLAGVGAWELFRFTRAGGTPALDAIGIPLAALMPLGAHAVRIGWLDAPLAAGGAVFVMLAGAVLWARSPTERPLGSIAVTVFGVLYAGATLAYAYALRHHRFVVEPAAGAALVFFPIALTWLSDTGAYFVGRAFGKRKLMPTVSPGKTVAGAIGGVVATMAGAWVYNDQLLRPVAQLALAPWTALVFGAVISAVGQVGDLVESLFKREAGVKDSSTLFSAHGGVLDRLDSLYFAIPVAYLILGRLLLAAPR
ncbi:MAG TPA: phosphatidate cytidylyltransferase [Gemmatimonadaceae bacterium]